MKQKGVDWNNKDSVIVCNDRNIINSKMGNNIIPVTSVHYFKTCHVLENLMRDFLEAVLAEKSETQMNRYHHCYIYSLR